MSFPSTNLEIKIVLPISFLAAPVLFPRAGIWRMGRVADLVLPEDLVRVEDKAYDADCAANPNVLACPQDSFLQDD